MAEEGMDEKMIARLVKVSEKDSIGIYQFQQYLYTCNWNLGHAKYEKVAIYTVNQRISNIWRIAGAA